jgi:hypothetical protein
MAFDIIIQTKANLEVIDAIDYYISKYKSQEAGDKFYKDFLDRIEELQTNPFFYSFYSGTFRRINLKKYKYTIIFEILNNHTIIVNTVFHSNTNPSLISKRLYEQ